MVVVPPRREPGYSGIVVPPRRKPGYSGIVASFKETLDILYWVLPK